MRVETIGNATLYLGDCREVIASLEFDSVITDPPYGVGFTGKKYQDKGRIVDRKTGGYESTPDTPEYVSSVVIPALQLALGKSKRGAVTPGTRSMFMYPEPAAVGTFHNPAGNGLSSWGFKCSQPILYYGKCPYMAAGLGARHDSYSSAQAGEDANETGHPCAKPLHQMKWLVDRASATGETVLDPFMGSGTTGVACMHTGRKFIGIEIEPKYFGIACKRIDAAQSQRRLFA